MRNIISGIALSLFVIFSLSSCETDNKTLLTDGVWDFSNMATDSQNDDVIGLITLGKAVMTNATLEFQEAGTYILVSPLLDDPLTGDWSLVGDDQLILDADDQAPSTSNIETLTKDKLTYIETFTDTEMNPYSVTTTWTRN